MTATAANRLISDIIETTIDFRSAIPGFSVSPSERGLQAVIETRRLFVPIGAAGREYLNKFSRKSRRTYGAPRQGLPRMVMLIMPNRDG
jgi:hypothetical protein